MPQSKKQKKQKQLINENENKQERKERLNWKKQKTVETHLEKNEEVQPQQSHLGNSPTIPCLALGVRFIGILLPSPRLFTRQYLKIYKLIFYNLQDMYEFLALYIVHLKTQRFRENVIKLSLSLSLSRTFALSSHMVHPHPLHIHSNYAKSAHG